MLVGFRLGGYPAGRDRWGGKRAAGGMSEDHDRCFSMLVLGAFSTGVFSTPMHYPALTLAPTCGASRASSQVFIKAGARLLCTSDGVCVIVYVQFPSVGAGMVWEGGVLVATRTPHIAGQPS